MPKVRQSTVDKIETDFARNCLQWEVLSEGTLCNYVVQQGVVHLLRVDRKTDIKSILSSMSYLMQRVIYGPHNITQLGLEYGMISEISDVFEEWKEFILSIQHLLKRAPIHWGAERILLQQAFEYCSNRIQNEAKKWQTENRSWPMLLQRNSDTLPIKRPIIVLQGHRDEVVGTIKISTTHCLSWSRDNTLMLWNLHTGELEVEFQSHTHIISEVIVDQERIYSFSWDKTVCIWDISGDLISSHTISSSIIQGAFKFSNGFVFGDNEELYFADLAFKNISKVISDVDAYGIFPATLVGQHVVSWYDIGEFQIWSCTQRTSLHTIAAHQGESVRDVLALDDKRFITWAGPEDYLLERGEQPNTRQTLCMWTIEGDLLWSIDAHHTAIRGVKRVSEDQIVSWGWDTELRLWNMTNGTLMNRLSVGEQIDDLLVLKDDSIVFSSGPAGRISSRLNRWSINGTHQQYYFTGENIISFIEQADWLLVSVGEGKIVRFDPRRLTEEGVFLGHKGTVHPIIPWGQKRFITCSDDESLRLWDIDISVTLELNPGHRTSILGVVQMKDSIISFSPDSIWCWPLRNDPPFSIVGSGANLDLGELKGALKWTDHELICWNAQHIFMLNIETLSVQQFSTGNTVISHHYRFPWSIIRSKNRLISASEEGTVALWSIQTLSLIKEIKQHESEVLGVSVLTDKRILSWSGEWFDTVLGDATVRIWDEELNPITVLEGHRSWLGGVCKQGNMLFSWSRDIRVWTLSGELIHILEGDAFVDQVRRYDERLLSWNGEDWSDCTVHLWDLNSGSEIIALKGHNQAVKNAVLLSTEKILSWSSEAIKLWSVESGDCLETWVLPDQATELSTLIWDSDIFDGPSFSGKGFLCTRNGLFWSNDGKWLQSEFSSEKKYILTSGETISLIESC